jgi:hypothetical protein
MARKQQRGGTQQWPVFDAPLLQAIAAAFRRRSKSLRYQAGLSCEREFSETADGVSERLNLDLRPDRGDLRLSVWQDGVMWLRLCVPAPGRNSGWAFLDQFYGSVLDVSPETLVSLTEATIAEPFHPGDTDPVAYRERLRTTWGRVRPYSDG